MRNKRQKPEDFVGWKSDDGLLEVVDMYGKQGTNTTYKVICHKCKEDKELFPLGYFVSNKGNLEHKGKPCGCSNKPKWTKEQFLILAKRAAKDRLIVHGFSEEFHGAKTKLALECLIDGHKWSANISNVIDGRGCPKCFRVETGNRCRTDENIAFKKCKSICETEKYEPIGFVDGYKNVNSRFEYLCHTHGIQNVSYSNFVNSGRRCKECAMYGYSTSKQGSFYVYHWEKGPHSFIKFGITNQKIYSRIKRQQNRTDYKYKKVWSATFEDGNIPLIIENYIKSSDILTSVVSKELFSDGFTETINMKDLATLENLIVDCVSKIFIE